ncbi:GntR family transcriptional regulator [Nocardioides speluncae]|uniref:GntR family transcriptional regulator n=1 Tax=Nocardioides speluncae TaxID=2670337 RepID=UPI000D6916CD|nr:GntR family transcriptional regulator [Nocardioides speluncae]
MRILTADQAPFADAALPEGDDQPAHARIADWLATAIARGQLADGDRLPSEQDLARVLGVSRMTLRQALAALESRELVSRRRGRGGGTFVSRRRIDVDLTGLPGFTEQMARAQKRASARVVRAEPVEVTHEIAEALWLPQDAPALLLVRVRLVDRQPLALEHTWMPPERFPGLLERRLTGSLYKLLEREYGVAPHTAQEWLEPVVADEEEATLLGVQPGAALMRITRTSYDEEGVPVEHAVDLYRADRSRISLRTGIGQAVPGRAARPR